MARPHQRISLSPTLRLARGERTVVRVAVNAEQRSIALFNVDDTLYAIDDSCPHQGASLAGGKLEGLNVQCPAHGLRFDLGTGCMRPHTGLAVQTYPVTVEGDRIVLTLPLPGSSTCEVPA